MIASLKGTLIATTSSTVLLECNGVGYEVWLPTSSFALLPEIGAQLRLHTSLVIRDDSHSLYGFFEIRERELFMTLIRISGIGAKSALGLLSALDAPALAQAVASSDVKALTRAPGIGRKNAERLLMELRDNPLLLEVPTGTPVLNQAIEALTALGYPATKARTALAGVTIGDMGVSDLVKVGLSELTAGNQRG